MFTLSFIILLFFTESVKKQWLLLVKQSLTVACFDCIFPLIWCLQQLQQVGLILVKYDLRISHDDITLNCCHSIFKIEPVQTCCVVSADRLVHSSRSSAAVLCPTIEWLKLGSLHQPLLSINQVQDNYLYLLTPNYVRNAIIRRN